MKQVWQYKIGNKKEFEKKGIPQEVKTVELEGLGQVDIVFLKGFAFSVIFQGEMLTPYLNQRNPFIKNQSSCWIDPENSDVWVAHEVNL